MSQTTSSLDLTYSGYKNDGKSDKKLFMFGTSWYLTAFKSRMRIKKYFVLEPEMIGSLKIFLNLRTRIPR